jgi:hypothetical protein
MQETIVNMPRPPRPCIPPPPNAKEELEKGIFHASMHEVYPIRYTHLSTEMKNSNLLFNS